MTTEPAPPDDGIDLPPGEREPIPEQAAPAPGPPGGRTFTLEGRPVPALYLLGWLLPIGGIAGLLISTQAAPSLARSILILASLGAIALGLLCAAGYQVVARAAWPPERYRGPSPLLVFALVIVLTGIVSSVVGGLGLVTVGSAPAFLASLLIIGGGYLVTTWLLVVRTGALTWQEMGWPARHPGAGRAAFVAAGIGIGAALPATLLAIGLGGILSGILGVEPGRVLPAAGTTAEALAIAFGAALIAPIGEELFFRGFVLSAWLRGHTVRGSILASAIFFAVVHIANLDATTFSEGFRQAFLQAAVILPVGIVLGVLFVRRGVVAAIAAHATYNGILLVLLALGTAAAS